MKQYFRERQPVVAMLYCILMLAAVFLTGTNREMPAIYAALFLTVGWKDWKEALTRLRGHTIMILFFGMFNVFFNHEGETPFLYVYDKPWTVESFCYGICSGFMICSLFLWFVFFQEIISREKITWMLGKHFPVISLMISMVFSYYDKFLYKIEKIKEVWNCFGGEEKYGKIYYHGILLSVLLSVMLEDSVETAQSMRARGYGTGERSRYRTYSCRREDWILTILIFLAVALLIVTGNAWQMRIVILLFPVGYNRYKELIWNYYQSMI